MVIGQPPLKIESSTLPLGRKTRKIVGSFRMVKFWLLGKKNIYIYISFLYVFFLGGGWDGSMIPTKTEYDNKMLMLGERGRTRYFWRFRFSSAFLLV